MVCREAVPSVDAVPDDQPVFPAEQNAAVVAAEGVGLVEGFRKHAFRSADESRYRTVRPVNAPTVGIHRIRRNGISEGQDRVMGSHIVHISPVRAPQTHLVVKKTGIWLLHDGSPVESDKQREHIHVIVPGVSAVVLGRHQKIVGVFAVAAFSAYET